MDIGQCPTRSEGMDSTWDEAKELATNRVEWRQRVAQCIQLDVG